MVTENAYLKKSIFLYVDMMIKKGEGSEGTVSCICKKTEDILVTEKTEIQSFTLNQNVICLLSSQIISNS